MSLARQIKAGRRSRAMSQADLAQLVGVSRVAISQWESGATFPSYERLRAVALALGLSVADIVEHHTAALAAPSPGSDEEEPTPVTEQPAPFRPSSSTFSRRQTDMRRDLPVRGIAACSSSDGAFQVNSPCVDYVRRPPALDGIPEAYGLYISGDSMEPKYAPGDLILVHPGRPVRPGDFVVLTIKQTPESDPSSFCKRLVRRHAGIVTVEQFNPILRRDFPEQVVQSMHKVLEMADLFSF